MNKIATFGKGAHAIWFVWKDELLRKVYVEYRAQNRSGIARILKRFLKALKQVHIESKNNTIKNIVLQNVEYGYKWLAAHCPECQIRTRTKNNERVQKRTYFFDYHFKSYVTFQSLQRLLRSSTDNRN